MTRSWVVLALALVHGNWLNAQMFNSEFWVADAVVRVTLMDEANELAYIGGDFETVGPNRPFAGCMDMATGKTILEQPVPNSQCNAVIPDGAGGWFIGGNFTAVGNMPRTRLARLNADGSLHPWAPSVTTSAFGGVHSLALKGDTLFIGGDFNTVGGQSRTNLAAVLVSSGNVLGFNPTANGDVTTLKVHEEVLYAGGDFSAPRSRLAAFDVNSGALLPLNASISGGNVYDILPSDDYLYVAGSFDMAYGQLRKGIAKVYIPGNSLESWDANCDGHVFGLEKFATTIYVTGDFNQIGSASRQNIAALDIGTALANNWDPSLNDAATDLSLSNDTLCVGGGWFTSVDGQERYKVAFFDINTGGLLNVTAHTGGLIRQVELNNGRFFAVGSFRSMGNKIRKGAAAIDLRTGEATTWAPNVLGDVWALAQAGSDIVLGGAFDTVAGQPRENLARVSATGTLDPWAPVANDRVQVAIVAGDSILVGGRFYQIDGQPRSRLALFNSTTGALDGWDPAANQDVKSIAIGYGRIYIGGSFTSVAGVSRSSIAVIDRSTGLVDPAFQLLGVPGQVEALLLHDQTLYMGGTFTGPFGTTTRGHVAAVDAVSGAVLPWDPQANGDVTSLAVLDSTVYIGGEFSQLGGSLRSRLGSVNSISGALRAWDPQVVGQLATVYDMAVGGPYLMVGGYFEALSSWSLFSNKLVTFNIMELSVPEVFPTSCHGDSLVVPFTTSEGFFFDNKYVAQLSDSAGHFDMPLDLDSIAGVSNDTLHIVIPSGIPSSSNYRIRVVATSPYRAGVSSDPFTINALSTWYQDSDIDGFGDPNSSMTSCLQPSGTVTDSTDCDDSVFGNNIGASCDDGDPNTINDTWTTSCVCEGDITIGIDEMQSYGALRAWPNPANDRLELSQNVNGVVLDATGKTVLSINNERIVHLSELAPGLFFLRTDEGMWLKFIKE